MDSIISKKGSTFPLLSLYLLLIKALCKTKIHSCISEHFGETLISRIHNKLSGSHK